jgi:hypothetical protein
MNVPEVRKVCLECGKVEVETCPPEKEGKTVYGLCEECYQKGLERDPDLTRWAFGEGDEEE